LPDTDFRSPRGTVLPIHPASFTAMKLLDCSGGEICLTLF
jgi:hypothetical protein